MNNSLSVNNNFFEDFSKRQNYSEASLACIRETVSHLLATPTDVHSPGMLLGKIQSGKTKTFFGVIALAFDNGYDVAVVLTKGTIALAQQTYMRLRSDFRDFIEADELQIFDVMHMPERLTTWESRQKIVIVCKKEDDNLRRLENAFIGQHPFLREKKVLLIDDEADFASIGFHRTKQEGVKMNKIASQIDAFRKSLPRASFLQVTATPYSLYLQPESIEINNEYFRPVRPAFTVLVPVHDRYIGGIEYFEKSEEDGSISSYLHESVSPKELQTLREEDRRIFKTEDSLSSNAIRLLRKAIVNFIVGGCIRRLQSIKNDETPKKYSFLVHTERSKLTHTWQEQIVTTLHEMLFSAAKDNNNLFLALVEEAYGSLGESVGSLGLWLPDFQSVYTEVAKSLPFVMITKVNSEKDINVLLDDTGQLRLRTPLNIFIGGQILDRGLTIGGLIGFFYGRNPNKYQQDTVLQHSRMYGARPIADLAVTRFYTTDDIYDVMRNIHEFDTALRDAFAKGGHENGVVFIEKDARNRIVPCSPNKILLSTTTTLRPYKRLLPVGFQTDYKIRANVLVSDIDLIMNDIYKTYSEKDPILIDVKIAMDIVVKISQILKFEDDGYSWDTKAFVASMEYVTNTTRNEQQRKKLWCLVRRDRDLERKRTSGRFQNAPDTAHIEGRIARETAIDVPMIMLFRINGKKDQGWRDCPFWWPVLYMPRNMPTVVFASDTETTEIGNQIIL